LGVFLCFRRVCAAGLGNFLAKQTAKASCEAEKHKNESKATEAEEEKTIIRLSLYTRLFFLEKSDRSKGKKHDEFLFAPKLQLWQ
jgi:hypothetical protein